MGTGRSRLTSEVVVEGADKAAQDFAKVDDAQNKVAGGQAKGAESAEKATEANEKLGASTEDLTSLLSRVHPALGGVFDTVVKGSRVMGDLATRNIDVAGSWGKVTTAVRAHANSLKLFAAGGAAAAGVF